MRAEILSYSRSRGLFAGASLEGAVVKADEKANFGVYGEEVSAKELLTQSGREVPTAAKGFVDELNKLAPRPSGWKQ
jgi:lipid-binding SYLF domain-containing protein